MKRFLAIFVIFALMVTIGIALAESPVKSTGRMLYSALIFSGRIYIRGCVIETDGSNDAVVTVYDSTNGTGKIFKKITVPGSDFYGGFVLPYPALMENGIYVTITGSGTGAYWVDYQGLY